MNNNLNKFFEKLNKAEVIRNNVGKIYTLNKDIEMFSKKAFDINVHCPGNQMWPRSTVKFGTQIKYLGLKMIGSDAYHNFESIEDLEIFLIPDVTFESTILNDDPFY